MTATTKHKMNNGDTEMSALITLTNKLAAKLDMGEGRELVDTLKATAFKGQVSDAQMTALLVVATQYGLNPWTKEIYAFPDKNNGIVPVVGVDGWSRIINGHPQFDGIEFVEDSESCTCIIYRKDRSHPTKVTEYMGECKRNAGPWLSHPRRMLRHKAMIQCARLAFGYVGIFEPDEAERIVEIDMGTVQRVSRPTTQAELPEYPSDQFDASWPKWEASMKAGKIDANRIIDTVSSKFRMTDAQVSRIYDLYESMNEGAE